MTTSDDGNKAVMKEDFDRTVEVSACRNLYHLLPVLAVAVAAPVLFLASAATSTYINNQGCVDSSDDDCVEEKYTDFGRTWPFGVAGVLIGEAALIFLVTACRSCNKGKCTSSAADEASTEISKGLLPL